MELTQAARLAGWPTPLAVERERDEETMAKCAAFREKSGRKTVPIYLGEAAQLAGWPTPTTMIDNIAHTPERWDERNRAAKAQNPKLGNVEKPLATVAQLAGWGTPTAEDAKSSSLRFVPSEQNRDPNVLRNQIYLAGWATPQAGDAKSHRNQTSNRHNPNDKHHDGQTLSDQIRGLPPSGSPASTERRGALNPLFSLWLMLGSGELARAWASCAEPATPSSRRSQRNSSAP